MKQVLILGLIGWVTAAGAGTQVIHTPDGMVTLLSPQFRYAGHDIPIDIDSNLSGVCRFLGYAGGFSGAAIRAHLPAKELAALDGAGRLESIHNTDEWYEDDRVIPPEQVYPHAVIDLITCQDPGAHPVASREYESAGQNEDGSWSFWRPKYGGLPLSGGSNDDGSNLDGVCRQYGFEKARPSACMKKWVDENRQNFVLIDGSGTFAGYHELLPSTGPEQEIEFMTCERRSESK